MGSLSELAITFGQWGVACGSSNRKYKWRAILIIVLARALSSFHLTRENTYHF